MPHNPLDQSTYQVRFEWGVAGLARLAPSDIVVVIDVLGWSSDVIRSMEIDQSDAPDAGQHAVAVAAANTGALVLAGGLRNATAVAWAIHAEQVRRGGRTSVAMIACGDLDTDGLRFAVEDQLGAGAVIDALAARGIDHSSPEAAVCGESFRSLRRAVSHLLTASAAGRAFIDDGRRDEVLAAARLDAASVVPVLDDGVFRPL